MKVAEQRLAKTCQLRWTRSVSSGQPYGKLQHHQRLDAGGTVKGTTVFPTNCCPAETSDPALLLEASSTVRSHLTLTTLQRADHDQCRINPGSGASNSYYLHFVRGRRTLSKADRRSRRAGSAKELEHKAGDAPQTHLAPDVESLRTAFQLASHSFVSDMQEVRITEKDSSKHTDLLEWLERTNLGSQFLRRELLSTTSNKAEFMTNSMRESFAVR